MGWHLFRLRGGDLVSSARPEDWLGQVSWADLLFCSWIESWEQSKLYVETLGRVCCNSRGRWRGSVIRLAPDVVEICDSLEPLEQAFINHNPINRGLLPIDRPACHKTAGLDKS
jgi:hypothetical protein